MLSAIIRTVSVFSSPTGTLRLLILRSLLNLILFVVHILGK